jgi:hypothetical protein
MIDEQPLIGGGGSVDKKGQKGKKNVEHAKFLQYLHLLP